MNKLKNIAFGLAGGWFVVANLLLWAAAYAISVIGIKKAYTLVKCASFCLAPFGKTVHTDFMSHKFGNAFWSATTGWQVALLCMFFTCFWYATVLGAYIGKKFFAMAQYAVAPFGAKFYPLSLIEEIKPDNDFGVIVE